jgi:hypothetical protein
VIVTLDCNGFYLLDLLYCSWCSHAMTSTVLGVQRYYQCPPSCRRKHLLDADWIETIIARALAGRLRVPNAGNPLPYAHRALAKIRIGAPAMNDIRLRWN